jgi:hypothetical protein
MLFSQLAKIDAKYYGPLYVFSNDPHLYVCAELVRSVATTPEQAFEVGDSLWRYFGDNVVEYYVEHVRRIWTGVVDYHCKRVSNDTRAQFRSNIYECFHSEEAARMHQFKVHTLLVDSLTADEPVYAPFVQQYEVGQLLYDAEHRYVRAGTVQSIHMWPNNAGCMYVMQELGVSGIQYWVHSDNKCITADVEEAKRFVREKLSANNPHAKLFNVDDILYDVSLDNSLRNYRVINVDPRTVVARFDAVNIVSGHIVGFYSDDCHVWRTSAEAVHHAFLMKFEDDFRNANAARSASPVPSLLDFCSVRASSADPPLRLFSRSPSPAPLPLDPEPQEPSPAAAPPPSAPRPRVKRMRKERRALFQASAASRPRRFAVEPTRLTYP